MKASERFLRCTTECLDGAKEVLYFKGIFVCFRWIHIRRPGNSRGEAEEGKFPRGRFNPADFCSSGHEQIGEWRRDNSQRWTLCDWKLRGRGFVWLIKGTRV